MGTLAMNLIWGLNRFYCRDSTNKICFHWFIRFKYKYNTITRSTNNIGIQDFFRGKDDRLPFLQYCFIFFVQRLWNLALCPEWAQNDWMICLMTQYGRQGNPIPHNSPTGLPLHLKIMPQYFRCSSLPADPQASPQHVFPCYMENKNTGPVQSWDYFHFHPGFLFVCWQLLAKEHSNFLKIVLCWIMTGSWTTRPTWWENGTSGSAKGRWEERSPVVKNHTMYR
jgi:hypothetical protein